MKNTNDILKNRKKRGQWVSKFFFSSLESERRWRLVIIILQTLSLQSNFVPSIFILCATLFFIVFGFWVSSGCNWCVEEEGKGLENVRKWLSQGRT